MAAGKLLRFCSVLLWASSSFVRAQDAALLTQGGLEEASANDDSFNTGGFVSVNGFNVTVPKNLIVAFPAAYVPWKDFVREKESMIGFEIQVVGNFVNGVAMAAQITVNEFFEGLNQGFIESINHEEGTMQIRAGPKIRISDPNAVFSVGYDKFPFFTADDENPSIASYSGFPMCIPKNSSDPGCPSSNRPFAGSGSFAVPDPLSMAPFLPGDFVSFSGIRKNNEVICYSIVAMNIHIVTLNNLVYIRMEEALIGVANTASNNAELAESRIIGFTSNNRATIALYAMDIDPCTGEVTDRIVAAVPVNANAQARFRWRADILTGYARDYRAVAEINGRPQTRLTKNGFMAGTYVQPVNEFIHGEQDVPGTPPPANDFSQLPWLTEGVGLDDDGNLWGALDPFPQTGLLLEPVDCSAKLKTMRKRAPPKERTWESSAKLLNYELPLTHVVVANSTETITKEVVVVES